MLKTCKKISWKKYHGSVPVHVVVCLVDPDAGFTAFLFYKLQIHKGRAEFEQNNTNINKLTYRIYNMRVQQETEENWELKHTWDKHEAKYTHEDGTQVNQIWLKRQGSKTENIGTRQGSNKIKQEVTHSETHFKFVSLH